MPIQPNASPDELDSPFYVDNERLCKEWEAYILKHGGQINGRYNAWSFNLKTKVKTNRTWLIDIKKATYSNGFLLLSSKYQNLQEILMFRTRIKDTGCKDFYIGKSFFKRKSREHPFYTQVTQLLKEGINDRSLYSARFENSELTLIFHHKNDWFAMADKVLSFEWKN
jgi:hypothetical protein